jgi:hypothetical protein
METEGTIAPTYFRHAAVTIGRIEGQPLKAIR